MKIKATTIALVLTLTCMANPAMRTSPKRAPLRGPVKTVHSYRLATTDARRIEARGKNTYSYDSFNREGDIVLKMYIQDGEASDITFYNYDTNGLLINEQVRFDGGSTNRKDYTYDTSGNLIGEVHYMQGEYWGEKFYRYTSGKRTMKIDSFLSLKEITLYQYDEKGNLAKETVQQSAWGDLVTKYTWYPDGNMRSETTMYTQGALRTTYTYDEHNNEILAEENIDNAPPHRRFESEYMYDKYGNWIRCTEDVPNDNPNYHIKQTTIRKIEYY